MADHEKILDRHFELHDEICRAYSKRETDKNALSEAIKFCKMQIELAPQAAIAFKRPAHIKDDLPHHAGFKQLCIIYEKAGQFDDAIKSAKEAQQQGWGATVNENWEKRIQRLQKKKEKSIKK